MYPALNLAETLKRRTDGAIDVLMVGARRGVEARIYARAGVPYELLPLQPIHRHAPWRNWRLGPALVGTAWRMPRLFRRFAPDLVVGTGGYAAGPVVAWAVLRRIPTAIQEQNSYPGLVTRWLARWVDQVHLGFPEAGRHLRPGKRTRVEVHGNPIRWPDPPPDPVEARRSLGLRSGPVVLVIGGSQGAAAVNAAMLESLRAVATGRGRRLAPDAEILWSTGPDHFEGVAGRLAAIDHGMRVTVVPYIEEMVGALAVATLAVSRAGALALAELCAWGVPSVLVPLPRAAADHQRVNAESLARAGAAVVVEERTLADNPDALWRAVHGLANDPERLARMARAARSRGRPDAAERIAADLLELLEER